MMKLDRIVMATDFSQPSMDAATWLGSVFGRDAEVVLCHVVDIPAPPGPLRGLATPPAALEATAREGAERRLLDLGRAAGLQRSRIEIRTGDPAESIAAVAREHGADLIVVGARRAGGGVLKWVGSTAERLLTRAHVPVLFASPASAGPPRHVLAAIDESSVSAAVTTWSHELARRFGVADTTLSVVSSVVATSILAPAGEAGAAESGARGAPGGPPREGRGEWIDLALGAQGRGDQAPEVVFGEAGHEILAAAERHGSGLIVIGRRGAGRTRRALFGSVTREVIRGARCPVLVVPEPDA